ncbi:hypothetical protein D9M71_770650 [compost metagenome]
MHSVQCIVDAKNRLLNGNAGVFRKFRFQLESHHQQTGNHRHQRHCNEQQQLHHAAPRVHDFRHRLIVLRSETVRGEQLSPEPMYLLSGLL